MSTLRRACSAIRLASLALVVVLPEPCRPTIMIGTGGAALRSTGSPRSPRVSISWSCTIFTTICPGVTDLMTSIPTAWLLTLSMKARATSSATSASSSARRTSRSAASTSASVSAPRRVRRSRMPPSRSESESNIVPNTYLCCVTFRGRRFCPRPAKRGEGSRLDQQAPAGEGRHNLPLTPTLSPFASLTGRGSAPRLPRVHAAHVTQ